MEQAYLRVTRDYWTWSWLPVSLETEDQSQHRLLPTDDLSAATHPPLATLPSAHSGHTVHKSRPLLSSLTCTALFRKLCKHPPDSLPAPASSYGEQWVLLTLNSVLSGSQLFSEAHQGVSPENSGV